MNSQQIPQLKAEFDDFLARFKALLKYTWSTESPHRWDPVNGCLENCPRCEFERLLVEAVSKRLDTALAAQDSMAEMFSLQQALNLRCGVDTRAMSDEDKGKWVLNYCRALSQETAELVDSVPWKWWAKYQKFDEQNARVEVVDLFHFVISLAQVLGMSHADVFRIYMEKNKVNHARQDSGYAEKTDDNSKIV